MKRAVFLLGAITLSACGATTSQTDITTPVIIPEDGTSAPSFIGQVSENPVFGFIAVGVTASTTTY